MLVEEHLYAQLQHYSDLSTLYTIHDESTDANVRRFIMQAIDGLVQTGESLVLAIHYARKTP